MSSPTLQAGVARQVISPPPGIFLMGYAAREQGNLGVHDDVYATTLVIDDGISRAALISVDHAFINLTIVDRIKAALLALGIPSQAVFVCTSHTHSGPIGYAGSDSPPADNEYIAYLIRQIVAAVTDASARLQPATLHWGQDSAEININRRERTANGEIIIGNNPDGPVDHAVRVLQLRTSADQPLVTLVNYACHPVVLGPRNRLVSADWVGAMRRHVEAQTSGLCLFIQGACGDINPRQRSWDRDNWDEAEAQGHEVAAAVLRAGDKLQPLAHGAVWSQQSQVWLCLLPQTGYPATLRAFFPPERQADDEFIRRMIQSMFPWFVAVEERDGMLFSSIAVGVLRIGNWSLATIGAEPFTETGAAVRAASPSPALFVAGYTNGCNSYLPPDSAHDDGGYEVDAAARFYGMPAGFARGSEPAVVAELKRLLDQSKNA